MLRAATSLAFILGRNAPLLLFGNGGYRLIRWKRPFALPWHSVGFGCVIVFALLMGCATECQ
jgi:hypothetical protein